MPGRNEIRTPIITLDGLTPGKHTLTIQVTGEKNADADGSEVVVDAFDVDAPIVSHLQEMDPDVAYNWRPVPIEAFQHEIFRADGLTPGMHTLMIEQQVNGGYIVVDAFDVRQ